jgi:hypothetical protein
LKNKRTFVVIVNQHGGHGQWSMPIRITDNLGSALKTAKSAENLGFAFKSIDDDICVYLMQDEVIFRSNDHHLIFVRRPSARRDLPQRLSCYEEWRNIHLIKSEIIRLNRSGDIALPIKVACGYEYSSELLISRIEELV